MESDTAGESMNERQMSALVFDEPAPDTAMTRVTQMDVPEAGPGEVLIKVAYAGVNFKDVMVRRGDPGYVDAWPIVPGLEVSGTIAALGPGVDSLGVGQAVAALTNQGGFAEYAVADAQLTCAVPTEVSLQTAAVAPAALASAELLVNSIARLAPGDVLAVHSAAGAVGEAIAQLVADMEVTLVALVGSESRAALAEQLGYEHAFVRGSTLVADVRARLADREVTAILDSQGTRWLDDDLELLAPGGRVVLFGNAAGDTFGPLPPASTLMRKNAVVGGFSLAGFSKASPPRMRDAIERTLARLSAKNMRPSLIVEKGLDSVPRLHDLLASGSGGGRKYVVQVSDEPA